MHPAGDLQVTELLVVTPPEPLATFLDERRYLPKGVPLLKHIAALPGQTVCRTGDTISIDGTAMGEALDRDHRGRSLPVWQGCRVIAERPGFPDEPAVRRIPRRPVFRPAAQRQRSSAGPIQSGSRRTQ